jgi:hypothetical protein
MYNSGNFRKRMSHQALELSTYQRAQEEQAEQLIAGLEWWEDYQPSRYPLEEILDWYSRPNVLVLIALDCQVNCGRRLPHRWK